MLHCYLITINTDIFTSYLFITEIKEENIMEKQKRIIYIFYSITISTLKFNVYKKSYIWYIGTKLIASKNPAKIHKYYKNIHTNAIKIYKYYKNI